MTYSFMGEEISPELIDTINEYVSDFLEVGIPKKQYELFLQQLLQVLPDYQTVKAQKRHARKMCQHFLNQWERTVR